MTSTTLDQRIELAAQQAKQVSFAFVLVRTIALFFYATGYVPGKLWVGVVFAGIFIRQGWREAQGKAETQAVARAPGASG